MAAAGLAEVLGHHERGVALASWLSRTPLLRALLARQATPIVGAAHSHVAGFAFPHLWHRVALGREGSRPTRLHCAAAPAWQHPPRPPVNVEQVLVLAGERAGEELRAPSVSPFSRRPVEVQKEGRIARRNLAGRLAVGVEVVGEACWPLPTLSLVRKLRDEDRCIRIYDQARRFGATLQECKPEHCLVKVVSFEQHALEHKQQAPR